MDWDDLSINSLSCLTLLLLCHLQHLTLLATFNHIIFGEVVKDDANKDCWNNLKAIDEGEDGEPGAWDVISEDVSSDQFDDDCGDGGRGEFFKDLIGNDGSGTLTLAKMS